MTGGRLKTAAGLFWYFFRIGWYTFGGGWSIVAQIEIGRASCRERV